MRPLLVAKVFVAPPDPFSNEEDLFRQLCARLDVIEQRPRRATTVPVDLEIRRNPDASSPRVFDEEFLSFPLVVEVYGDPAEDRAADQVVASLRVVVESLRRAGATYVVASEYEEQLGGLSRND